MSHLFDKVLRLGIDPLTFWDLTPTETYILIDAKRWQRKEEVADMLFVSWHTAALSRTKRIPSLKNLLHPTPRKLTPSQMADRRREFQQAKKSVDVDSLIKRLKI